MMLLLMGSGSALRGDGVGVKAFDCIERGLNCPFHPGRNVGRMLTGQNDAAIDLAQIAVMLFTAAFAHMP